MTIQEKLFEDLKKQILIKNGYPLFTVFMTETKMGKNNPVNNNQIYVEFRFIEALQLIKNPQYKLKVIELLEQWLKENKNQLLL